MTNSIVFRRSALAGCLIALLFRHTLASPISRQSSLLSGISQWGIADSRIPLICNPHTLMLLRGGQLKEANNEEDEGDEYDEEYDDQEDEEEESEEEEDNDEEEEVEIAPAVVEYDAPLELPPTIQMGTMLALMVLTKKLDMYDPKIVRLGRFIFVAFVVSQQVFCLYVRIRAKLNNNRTPIETKNVLSGLLNSQLQNQDMIKNLASSFLSTQSTVMEYDLKQAKNMNGGILFNMAFMWFLHFKMGQTQPLFFQTVQGLTNLIFNPLFQCYVLGRNLERPFKVGALANVPVEVDEPETVIMTEDSVIETALKEVIIEDTTDEDEDDEDEDDEDDEDDDEDEDVVDANMESSLQEAEDIDTLAQDNALVTEDVVAESDAEDVEPFVESAAADETVAEISADEVDVLVETENETPVDISIANEDVFDEVDDPIPATTNVDDNDDAKEDYSKE